MKKSLNTSLSLRKVLLSALVAAPLATLPAPLWALPSTGSTNLTSSSTSTVVGTVGTSILNITTPDRTVLKWVEFGSGANTIVTTDTINYNLPSSTSSVLNYVTGSSASTIDGTLYSNGQILLLNQNGIIVSSAGRINASGVTLSTRPENEFAYVAGGTLGFSGTPTTDIQMGGVITVGSSGNVVMQAKNVTVTGTVDAGVLTVNASSGGNVNLGNNGAADVVIGNAGSKYGALSVSTNGGTLNINTGGAGNVVVAGGNTTVTTSNGNVVQTTGGGGVFKGGLGDSSLSINAGSGSVTLGAVNVNGSGKTLTTTVTASSASITSPADNLAVAGTTTGNLTATAAGDLTLNASTVGGNLIATSTGGNVKSGGVVATTGTVALSAAAGGKGITYSGTGTLASITSNATGSVSLTSSADVALPTITTKTLSVTTSGNITQTGALTIAGDTTVDAAQTTLTNAGNDFTNLVIKNNANGASFTDINNVTIKGGTTTTGDVNVTAATGITLGTGASDTISVGGNLTLTTLNAAALVAGTVTVNGSGYTSAPTFSLTGGGGTGGSGTSTLGIAAISAPTTGGTGYTSNPTVTLTGGGGTGAAATATLTIVSIGLPTVGSGYQAGNTITINAGGTSLATATVSSVDSVGQITGITLTSGGSRLTNLAGATITFGNGTGTGTGTGANLTLYGAVDNVNVTTAGSGYASLPTVSFSAPSAGVTATGSSATGLVTGITVTNQGSGYTSAPTVAFASGAAAASVTLGSGGITQANDNLTVLGNLNLTSPGTITIAGSKGTAVGLNNTLRQVNVTQASTNNVTLFATTALNLGTITTGGTLKAYSPTSIVNSGKVTAPTVKVGAGTATAPGNINIDYTNSSATPAIAGNAIGSLTILTDLELAQPSSNVLGYYLANNLTIVNDGSLTVTVPANVYGTGLGGNLNLTSANGTVTLGGSIIAGNVALSGKTGVLATGSNTISNYTVTSSGTVDVRSTTALTVNGNLTGGASTANLQSDNNLTIGTFTSTNTGAITFKTTGKNDIVDSVPGISIYGPVTFATGQGLNVARSGHSFGAVTITANSNDSTVSLAESGTLSIAGIALGSKNTTVNLVSTNGDITQAGAITGGNSGKTMSFKASSGKVTLTNAGNGIADSIAITSNGDISLVNTSAVGLGAVVTFGKLNVSSGGDITQSGSSTIWAYGDTTLATTGNIKVTNSGNNFGGLILSGAKVALTESGTLNVKSIQTVGTIALTSETADIINTTDSNVALNKISNGGTATGAATFTASKGNVTVNLANSVLGPVSFTTGGNVTVVQPTGDLWFGASTIGGNLTATTQGAGNAIRQSGALTVTGLSALTTNAGYITLDNSANVFGPVRFTVGAGSTAITTNSNFNLASGSVATAPVLLTASGNFITTGTGGSSFTNALTINAIGTIIPSAGSLLVTGTFTVFSNNTKDLSALSKSGNLAGHDPVNLGTGTYVAPSP